MSTEANSRRSSGKSSANSAAKGGPRKSGQPRHAKRGSGENKQQPWVKEGDKAARQSDRQATNNKVSSATLRQHRLEEAKVQGENACRVCFKQRPQSVVKMYVEANMAKKFADVMKYLAANKYAYHIVENAELERIAGSEHHGGVVLIVKRKPELTLAAYLAANKHLQQDCLLALDGVGNPHNLGAIVRSCAHFGVKGLIMTQPYLLHSGAAARTAEGGIEFVDGLSCDSLPQALQQCKQAGYSLVTTSSHASVSLYQSKLASKVVVVFGEEMDGVSPQVAKGTDVALQIPGSGQVESLNVSVAASLILGEWYRQQRC